MTREQYIQLVELLKIYRRNLDEQKVQMQKTEQNEKWYRMAQEYLTARLNDAFQIECHIGSEMQGE